MADKEPQEEAAWRPDATEEAALEAPLPFWHNDPTMAPELYIKTSTITASYSDVTLLLGNPYWESQGRINLCKLRLMMSHYDFFEFAENVRKQAAFLEKLYKGNSPGPIFTQEEYDAAWKEVYGET